MAEKLFGTIETQITDGLNLTTLSTIGQTINTYTSDATPQIQTVVDPGSTILASVINAPFVEVTSVNGMTGDVITEPILKNFETNHYYPKNTMIERNSSLFWAKNNFTSGDSFNPSDWTQLALEGSVSWANVLNKPEFAAVATSGAYSDLSGTPTLARVATSGLYSDLSGTPTLARVAGTGLYSDLVGTPNLATVATTGRYSDLLNLPTIGTGSLTIKRNGTSVGSFGANATSNVEVNISVPTKTSEITNDSNFVDSPIQTDDIEDLAITTPKIANGSITGTLNYASTPGTGKLALKTVGGSNLRDDCITNAHLASDLLTIERRPIRNLNMSFPTDPSNGNEYVFPVRELFTENMSLSEKPYFDRLLCSFRINANNEGYFRIGTVSDAICTRQAIRLSGGSISADSGTGQVNLAFRIKPGLNVIEFYITPITLLGSTDTVQDIMAFAVQSKTTPSAWGDNQFFHFGSTFSTRNRTGVGMFFTGGIVDSIKDYKVFGIKDPTLETAHT